MSDPVPPSGETRLGQRFGKYVLVQKIAEGGMAEIFLAKQLGVEGFEKNVVIKRMHAALSQSTEFVQMFLDEARLASSLVHPNIVHVLDLGLTQGYYYICMEYLAGDDLATVLRAARVRGMKLPTHIVLRIVAEAARGLHYAHEYTYSDGRPLNIVHRDVSPSNIFITYSGAVKLLDFGIAKAESTVVQTTAGIVKGKYQYMSPEQALGERVDRRTDIYALGVTAYEALTLHRPFARDTDLAILKAVLAGERPPIESLRADVPDDVCASISKAMALDVTVRYQTAAQLAEVLEAAVATVTSAASSQVLSTFLRDYFDQQHIKVRSRIPSLTELQIVVPPEEPTARNERPGDSPEVPTKANSTGVVLSGEEGTQRQQLQVSRAPIFLALGVAAIALVVAFVAVWAVLTTRRQHDVPDAATAVDPIVTNPVQPGTGSTTGQQTVDAGPAEAPEDAGAAVKPPPVKPPRVVLTSPVVRKVMASNTARIQGCFVKHRDLLESASGRVTLTLTIASSGRVTAVEVDHAPAPLSACLESSAKAIQFPAHVDAQVIVPLPVSYDIR